MWNRSTSGNQDFTSNTCRVLLVPAYTLSMFSICRQPVGKIRRSMKCLPNVEILAKSLFSTPGLVQRTPFVYEILIKCKYSQIHWHNYQAFFFPNINISIKHRQIGGQSVRFALHKRFSITVGCRFAWRRIRWFQQSRDSLKGRGSSDVCQVSIGPTRAAPLYPLFDSECSVLPTDIQDPNSNAIATQYCNSTLLQGNVFQPLAVPRLKNPFAWSPQWVSTPGLVQQLLWFMKFFSSVNTARFIGIITKHSFFQISISR